MKSPAPRVIVIVSVLSLAASAGAAPALHHDNGTPDHVSGTNMSEQLVAEDFTVDFPTTLTRIGFWAILKAPGEYRDSVTWAIHLDASNQPGALVAGAEAPSVPAVATGSSTAFGYSGYAFEFEVDVDLVPGSYWLLLHNGPSANLSPSEMLWATTATPLGSNTLYLDVSSGWVSTGNESAFFLLETHIFTDGFETGDSGAWSSTAP